jgi:HAD superfamily hydrolase (TIGR01509 family)
MSGALIDDLRAALFDLDGTLCDSAPLHFEAWRRALADRGRSAPTWDDYVEHCLRRQRRFEDVLALTSDETALLYSEKSAHFAALAEEGLRALPGVEEFWQRLRALGVAIGIVSTARRSSVELALRAMRLPEPDVAITREDVEPNVKPHPAGYQLAVARLGVPERCTIVFEDSPPGIAAARAAGLLCVAAPSKIFGREDQKEADAYFESWSDVWLDVPLISSQSANVTSKTAIGIQTSAAAVPPTKSRISSGSATTSSAEAKSPSEDIQSGIERARRKR